MPDRIAFRGAGTSARWLCDGLAAQVLGMDEIIPILVDKTDD
jgi:hypothetical protein